MKTVNEMRLELVEAVAENSEFRRELLDAPHETIRNAFGVSVPESFELAVHEDAADLVHVVLPPKPALDLADLERVSGGHWSPFIGTHSHDSDNYFQGGDKKN